MFGVRNNFTTTTFFVSFKSLLNLRFVSSLSLSIQIFFWVSKRNVVSTQSWRMDLTRVTLVKSMRQLLQVVGKAQRWNANLYRSTMQTGA